MRGISPSKKAATTTVVVAVAAASKKSCHSDIDDLVERVWLVCASSSALSNFGNGVVEKNTTLDSDVTLLI